MLRRVPLLFVVLAALAQASSAAAASRGGAPAQAPGMVTFPLGSSPFLPSVDPSGLSTGVALPDGRVTLVGMDRGRGIVLVRLRRDGTLDPSFGTAGIARVATPFPAGMIGPDVLQLLRRPDGGLVAVVTGPSAARFEFPQLLLIALTAEGGLDPSYGVAGVATPGVAQSCGCTRVAMQADGKVVLTGNTGGSSPDVVRNPNAVGNQQWVVARVRTDGSLDPGFGTGGVTVLPATNAPGRAPAGYGVAALPDGHLGVLGFDGTGAKVARLTADGALDPGFNGGRPLTPGGGPGRYWWDIAPRADGALDVLSGSGSAGAVARFTPAGVPDAAYGTAGIVPVATGFSSESLGQIEPGPGGADLVFGSGLRPRTTVAAIVTSVVGPGGGVTTAAVTPPFGGGLASVFAAIREPQPMSLAQSGFRPGRAVVRPDGSVVVPGALGVIRYTGEGMGVGLEQAAVVSLTAGTFALDPAFGGPPTPATIGIRVPPQRAAVDATRRVLRVAVDADVSGPGLALLTVASRGRIVARSTAPVYGPGPQRLPAYLTKLGRRALRAARNVPVTVRADFRNLVGRTATARSRGRLR